MEIGGSSSIFCMSSEDLWWGQGTAKLTLNYSGYLRRTPKGRFNDANLTGAGKHIQGILDGMKGRKELMPTPPAVCKLCRMRGGGREGNILCLLSNDQEQENNHHAVQREYVFQRRWALEQIGKGMSHYLGVFTVSYALARLIDYMPTGTRSLVRRPVTPALISPARG